MLVVQFPVKFEMVQLGGLAYLLASGFDRRLHLSIQIADTLWQTQEPHLCTPKTCVCDKGAQASHSCYCWGFAKQGVTVFLK